jgi:hypothetical protein
MFSADAYPVIAVRDRIAIDYTLGGNRSPEGIEKYLWRDLFGFEPALCLRSVSVLTIAFGGLTCHRWPCMLLNLGFSVFSNPPLRYYLCNLVLTSW